MKKDLPSLSDSKLVSMITTDTNLQAFQVLYEKYKLHLANYIKSLHYKIPDEEIFDIVQESFVLAYHNLSKLKKPESFKSWFKVVP